jgi:hypothetical protein
MRLAGLVCVTLAFGCSGRTSITDSPQTDAGSPDGVATVAPPPAPAPAPPPPVVPPTADGPLSACADPGTGLTGAVWMLSLSRFAFGSTPTMTTTNGFTQYKGTDGVISIDSFGDVLGSMNATAPEASRPDFSTDTAVLSTHVADYFRAMGVVDCQVSRAQILAGTGGRNVQLERAVSGIPIAESQATARFDDQDQTTLEMMRWPALSATVVQAARAFRDQLAAPGGLDAYRAKLPPEARTTDGIVVIHHSTMPFKGTFHADVTWDTSVNGSTEFFDVDGKPVDPSW